MKGLSFIAHVLGRLLSRGRHAPLARDVGCKVREHRRRPVRGSRIVRLGCGSIQVAHGPGGIAMKSLRVVGLLVAAGLFAFVGTARAAQPCPAGCGMQKKACLQTARVAKLACRLDCRATAAPANLGACVRGCADQFRAAKNTCAADHTDCLGSCPPPPPGSCTGAFLDSCGQDLATCARSVVATAKTCVQGCGTAPDRLACLRGCAAAAQHDANTCAANFAACVGTCACPGGCDDGNACTFDTCVNGECRHECLCVGPAGDVTCCPGPGPCPVSTTTTTTLPGGTCQMDAECNPDGNPCVLAFCAAGACQQFCRCLQGTSFTCSPDQADTCQSVADCAPPVVGDPCRFCIGGLCMGHPFCV
jgi:hypothetical protein